MLKRFKIDGRMQEVFVLRETDSRVVYVPVKSMHRTDYERFKKMTSEKPPRVDMLDYMSKTKLSNGMNALVQYDRLIQVANIHNNIGTRVKKTEEIVDSFEHASLVAQSNAGVNPLPQQAFVAEPVVQQLQTSAPQEKPVYEFINRHGKKQQWSGQGRKPDVIQAHLDAGGNLEDFLVR